MNKLLIFYGSYRSGRQGYPFAKYLLNSFAARGAQPELIDAREVGLPMLDRMYKEYPKGEAPAAMETLAGKIREADAFVFVTGEYNWGVQPGLKNLTDHFLEEWFWRPVLIASYSAGRSGGAHSNVVWRGTLAEMGMIVISSTLSISDVSNTFDAEGRPAGPHSGSTVKAFDRAADDLAWWAQAARNQRAVKPPPF